MTIYVVMMKDGNVCCPAYELVSMYSTRELAEARIVQECQNNHTDTDDYWVEEHDVDSED